MVMGGDSCTEGRGFESQHCILDGQKNKERPWMAHLKNICFDFLIAFKCPPQDDQFFTSQSTFCFRYLLVVLIGLRVH